MRNILACTLAFFSLLASAQSPSSILSSLGVTGITSNRTARSSNMIVKTTAEGYIDSSLLPDTAASSFAGKQVYVDASFTGTNSNGSLSAPYTSLTQVSYTNGLRVLLAPGAYASTTLPAGVTNVYFLRDRPFSSYFPVTLSSVTATSSGIFGFSGVSLTTSSFPSGSKLLCYEGGTLSIVSGSTSVVVKDAKTTVSTSVPNFTYLDSATAIRYGSGSYPTVESALDYLFLQTTSGEARVAGTGLVYTAGSTLIALTNGAQGSVLSVGSNGVPTWRSPLVRAGNTNGALAIWNQTSGAFVPAYFPQPGLYGLWYTGLDTEFKSIGFPSSASVGDLLVWNGASWDALPNTNAVGYTLTSNGAGKLPTYTSTQETSAGTLLGQLAYWDPVSSLYRPLPVASTPNLLLVSGDNSTLPTWKSLQTISNSTSAAEASCLVPVPTLSTNSFLFMLVGTNADIDVSTIVREDPTVPRSTELALCTSSGIVARTRASGFNMQDNLQTVYVRFPELSQSSIYYVKYWWTNCLGQLVGKTNTAVLSSYLLEDTSKSSPSQDSSYPGFVWTTNSTDDSLILASYTGTLTRVVIPSTVYGRPVSAIGSYAFANGGGTNVTIVTGGDNITSLAVDAFRAHKQLTTVSLPNAYVVGDSAFLACPRLVQVDMPRVVEIGNNAFNSCTSLPYVVFFDAAYVGSSAFNSATALWYVYFPQVTTVLDQAFTGCSDLVEVNLPSVVSIGESAFSGCDSLVNLSAPAAEAIGFGAFYGCTGLASVDFPRASSIADGAFYECASLTEVTLPQAKTFGPEVFYGCTSLTNLTLTQDAPAESFDLFTGIPAGQVSVVVANPASQGWGTTWNGMPVVRSALTTSSLTLGGETRTNWPSGLTLSDVNARISEHNSTNTAHAELFAQASANTTGLVVSALSSVTRVYNPTNANEWYEIRGDERWTYTVTGESAYDAVNVVTGTITTNALPFPIPKEDRVYTYADLTFYCDYTDGNDYVAVAVVAGGALSDTAENIYPDTLDRVFSGPDSATICVIQAHGPTTGVVVTVTASAADLQLKADKTTTVSINGQIGNLGSNLTFSVGSATELFSPTNALMYTQISHGDIQSYENKVGSAWTMSVYDGVNELYVLPETPPFYADIPLTSGFSYSTNGFAVTTLSSNVVMFTGPGFTNTVTSDFGLPTIVATGDRYESRLDYVGIVSSTLFRASANVYETAETLRTNTVKTTQLPSLVVSNSVSSILIWTNSYGLVTQLARCDKGVWSTNQFSSFSTNEVSYTTLVARVDSAILRDWNGAILLGSPGSIATGDSAVAAGIDTEATGNGAFAIGDNTVASASFSYAAGYLALASNMYSYVWNGMFDSSYEQQPSRGTGTFCIYPEGGLAGFYIGSSNLLSLLQFYGGMYSNDVTLLDNKIVQVANYSTNSFNSAYSRANSAHARFGLDVAYLANGDEYSTYFGAGAGSESASLGSTYLGVSAGALATANYSTFVGESAGQSASGSYSMYVGRQVGGSSTATGSAFFGAHAGYRATGANLVCIDAYPVSPNAYPAGGATNDAIVLQNGYVNLGRGSAAPGGAKGGELRGVWKYAGKEISSGLTAGQFVASTNGFATNLIVHGALDLNGEQVISAVGVTNIAKSVVDANVPTLAQAANVGGFAGTETITPLNIVMGGYFQALLGDGASTIDSSAKGASQSGLNYGSLSIGANSHGASQSGLNYGSLSIGANSHGASQSGDNFGGSQSIGDSSHGASQSGYNEYLQSIGDSSHGASQSGLNYGSLSIGANSHGAMQRGQLLSADSSAINNAAGAVQIFSLTNGQHALTTTDGKASLLIGAGTISNKNTIVVGDNEYSHGVGSITAGGGFFGSGTGITIGGTNIQDAINQRVEKSGGTATNLSVSGTLNLNGEPVISAAGVTNVAISLQQLFATNHYTKAEIDTAQTAPYREWTGTITPANGTATVTYAHGNMPRLMITSPTVITLDPTDYGTNGVSRISLSLFSGTNSVTLATNVITYATTPTISTNFWNTILIRRVSNCAWKGVGL